MNENVLPSLDATAQADLVRRNEVQATQLVEAAITRIERLNPTLNAVVTPMFDEALERAAGDLPEACEHALTRSVRDSAALLDATSGPDVGDPYWAPPKARPYADEVGAHPGRLRVAVSTTAVTEVPVHADCVRAVQDTARLCEDLGHEVFEFTPSDLDGGAITEAFITVYTSAVAAAIAYWSRALGKTPTAADFEPLTWAMNELALSRTPADYLLAVGYLHSVSRQIGRYFTGFDLWLTPVLAEPPLPLGTFDAPEDQPLFPLMRAGAWVPFTPPVNFTGQPAMSVPLYWNEEGLPIGSHFIGRFGDEATLFRLAAQLEQARPWADRTPPVSA